MPGTKESILKFVVVITAVVTLLVTTGAAVPGVDQALPVLAAQDTLALAICEGVVELFKQHPGELWPGYDLAKTPFIYYMPGKWALLLNVTEPVTAFERYPEEWPRIGTDALVHIGPYENLDGQIAFDVPVGDLQVAAVPFEKDRATVERVAFVLHENFHQYQYQNFGEIPWQREELYPIDDRENTALAFVEMRLLMSAIEAAKANDPARCTERFKEFIAVRSDRWNRSDPFVERFEQGQELEEGTAKYVETKGIDLFAWLEYKSAVTPDSASIVREIPAVNVYDYLLDEFRRRMSGNSISPEDMPRNRIYPVACAQALVLDFVGIEWKTKAQQAGAQFTFAGLFEEYLEIERIEFPALLQEAKDACGYGKVLAATDALLRDYQAGYAAELKAFEEQGGYRLEIDMSAQNLRRSRSSAARKWLVDRGATELRNHFDVYSLESATDETFLLQVKDTGVLERNVWAAKTKTVAFFVEKEPSVAVDGVELDIKDGSAAFQTLEITGDNVKLDCVRPGTIAKTGKTIVVTLTPHK
jgi:hypothetical protein